MWSRRGNLASQAYLEDDLHRAKVAATADLCRAINRQLEVREVARRFRRSVETGDTIFCCVDSIEIRRLVWESVKDMASFFTDGRMSAEVVRILAATERRSRGYYPASLFATEEAYTGSCTAKTTIYCANIAAGLMIAQFAKYLRNLPVDCDFQ